MAGRQIVVDGAFALRVEHGEAAYDVRIAEPTGPPPDAGFPLVVLLDAEHSFGTLVEGIRLRARRPDATGVGPAIVVGIVPQVSGQERRARRAFDYMAWPGPRRDPHAVGLATGGAAAYLAWLEGPVRSLVAERFPINRAHQVLIGHSLAGLFALWALSAGSAFTDYVAVSPSLWWNPEALRQAFARAAGVQNFRPRRVLISVGEYEQRRAPWQPAGAITDDALARRVDRRMVDRAREAADLVRSAGHVVDYREFDGEDHASVLALTLSRALRFTLPPACRFNHALAEPPIPAPSAVAQDV